MLGTHWCITKYTFLWLIQKNGGHLQASHQAAQFVVSAFDLGRWKATLLGRLSGLRKRTSECKIQCTLDFNSYCGCIPLTSLILDLQSKIGSDCWLAGAWNLKVDPFSHGSPWVEVTLRLLVSSSCNQTIKNTIDKSIDQMEQTLQDQFKIPIWTIYLWGWILRIVI